MQGGAALKRTLPSLAPHSQQPPAPITLIGTAESWGEGCLRGKGLWLWHALRPLFAPLSSSAWVSTTIVRSGRPSPPTPCPLRSQISAASTPRFTQPTQGCLQGAGCSAAPARAQLQRPPLVQRRQWAAAARPLPAGSRSRVEKQWFGPGGQARAP
eukprot:scaffold1692_cov133-Isochrysis_galbana.AAC.4